MQILPSLRPGTASSHPTPVTVWQTLLSHLLNQHYGLTLSDTPFGNDGVIEQHIDTGISLCDALNFIVENMTWSGPTGQGSVSQCSPRSSPVSIFSGPEKPAA